MADGKRQYQGNGEDRMSEPVTPQPPYADAEVQALALTVKILDALDNGAQQRILRYLVARFPPAPQDRP
jgi:hypothetical protein